LGRSAPSRRLQYALSQAHDTGVLAATTAFGKTVVAAALIAQRGRNALVLVHRRELMTQWVERLRAFLSVDKGDVGSIGGGRRAPTGRIDVALIQSLVRKGEVDDIVGDYGHLIVDECHHVSAASFELVAQRVKARYVLGLSATVSRKDGHHPIIFMQCGPVRHQVSARQQAARRSFAHVVEPRETKFELPGELQVARPSMPTVYATLAADGRRNDLIVGDILNAVASGRSPLVLTERRDHLETLAERLRGEERSVIVLRGGMKAAERKASLAAVKLETRDRIIIATGSYLGEGFDDDRLDALFLTLPISWKGTLAQYVGRLHREHGAKQDVIVYDYIDAAVPMLARMATKRRLGYAALGYSIREATRATEDPPSLVGAAAAALLDLAVIPSGAPSDARNPTEIVDEDWIWAYRRAGEYPESTERGGKWLIFVGRQRVDGTWRKIRQLTEDGRLGGVSKCATSNSGPEARSMVICVYTYDSEDEADVMRVRATLREAGFGQKLTYKTDRATLDGQYYEPGRPRVSRWVG
jgi:superfamily II DNA or RNA helicase